MTSTLRPASRSRRRLDCTRLRTHGNLDDILCIHEERTLAGDNAVRYKGRSLQIPEDRHRHHYVPAKVRVRQYPDGHLAVFHGPRRLAVFEHDGTQREIDEKQAA